jgi:hypothetical protein
MTQLRFQHHLGFMQPGRSLAGWQKKHTGGGGGHACTMPPSSGVAARDRPQFNFQSFKLRENEASANSGGAEMANGHASQQQLPRTS